jgi:hypothetical protein
MECSPRRSTPYGVKQDVGGQNESPQHRMTPDGRRTKQVGGGGDVVPADSSIVPACQWYIV